MPFNPETIIGEVLGRRAVKGFDPASTGYICPFIQKACVKRSQQLANNEPYPICSLWKGTEKPKKGGDEGALGRRPTSDLIYVCPKRFYAVDFLKEVIGHCWPGDPPKNPKVAPEVKMAGFGNVDFVIADVRDDGEVGQFLSVELQAIDITGSVFPAYQALRTGVDLDKRPTYGMNWDNVYKRYVTQLIRKGYFHHHWKSKIVAVIPEQVYRYIVDRAKFLRVPNVKDDDVNIIFMTYCLEGDTARPGQFRPKLVTVEGTSHASLQAAMMYKDAPQKAVFADRIKQSLVRAVNLADLIKAGTIPEFETHEGEEEAS